MQRASNVLVVRLYLIAYWIRTVLYLILILGLWAALIHGAMELGKRLRGRRRYSAARIACATASASVFPA
jgi:hypothetical protein